MYSAQRGSGGPRVPCSVVTSREAPRPTAPHQRPANGPPPADEVIVSPARGIEMTLLQRLRTTPRLVVAWTTRDLRVRYRQSMLRSAWSLLQPLTILATYGWVVTAVLSVRNDDAPYLTFAWAGIVPMTCFSQALGQGVGSIQQAGPLITRLAFPREVLPLSVVGGATVDLVVMVATLVATSWIQVGAPDRHLLALLPVLATLLVWTAACTTAAAAITVFRRDLNFAVPLLLRVLFIVSPVVYPAALIADRSRWLVDLNPLAVVIEGTRDAVYRGVWPDARLLGLHFAGGVAALVATFAAFRRLEPAMTDHV